MRFRFVTLGISPIDVKLGVRMLVKNPGLTIVSTVALAIAIAIVAGFNTATQFMVRPTLPLPDGERIVAIWQHDTLAGERGTQTLGDLQTWTSELETLEDVGGFRLQERGINVDGATRFARVAEITPSAFELVRVPPELGRPLVDADAQPGGPAVAVIGYELWQTTLGADPQVIGRTLRIGGVPHTIVGVMPEGFSFPQSEKIWVPMPVPAGGVLPDQGPAIDFAFGRMVRGVALEDVDAELQVTAARLAAEYPESHAKLRPRVTRYANSFIESAEPELRMLMQLARTAVGVVLLIVAVNVGALIYARNAARIGEITVRAALGASRSRVVLQMFIEALILSSLAAVLGIAILLWPLTLLREVFDTWSAQGDGLPFWFDVGVSTNTFLIVVGLTLLSAFLTGALPALKLTRRDVHAQLQRVQQGSSGLKFGRMATLIVVSQVALSVALLTVGGAQLRSFVDDWSSRDDSGLARERILTADLRWDLDAAGNRPDDTRAALARAEARRELGRRAAAELDVQAVTSQNPRGVSVFFSESDTDQTAPGFRYGYISAVDPNFFDALDVPIVAGRALDASDSLDTAAPVAVVNQAFVESILIRGDPIGQRFRWIDPRTRQPGDWLRIVGVAEDMPALQISHRGPQWLAMPSVYTPLPDSASTVRMLLRARGEAASVIGPLRALAAEVDPTMIVHQPLTLAEADQSALTLAGIYGMAVGFFVFAGLLLSTTGVYAMMSFTTTQRTREIGIRTALGAPAARVVGAIFSRAMWQLGIGTLLGLGLGYLAADGPFALSGGLFADGPGVVVAVALLILMMGLIACGRPMRRALRVEPTVALRSDD
ncbi:MAG: ABC transporter permease [Gammaproteobacteria bacterium]